MGKRDKRKSNQTAEEKEKAKAKTEQKNAKAQQKQKKKELQSAGVKLMPCTMIYCVSHVNCNVQCTQSLHLK